MRVVMVRDLWDAPKHANSMFQSNADKCRISIRDADYTAYVDVMIDWKVVGSQTGTALVFDFGESTGDVGLISHGDLLLEVAPHPCSAWYVGYRMTG